MDVVFREEKEHLEGLERIIDKEAAAIEEKISEQKRVISEFICVDYSDRQELASLRKELSITQNEDEELRSYQSSPYFGRMDLETEDSSEIEQFYIGKKGIIINHNIHVLDWRSRVGQYFYIKTERRFQVNSTEYTLQLRRALEVQNAKLISYNTEYDGQAVSLEGDVIDPFLLTVLRDKRRQNRLTDIIKTIQENQNTIIRRPVNESFIVQGCAGSGKTMILLHRLSYLLFNHKEIAKGRIRIITPNKTFDVHINELSKELGLAEIERNSVEEFYVSLIKQYSHKMDVSASVNSEKELNSSLLKVIYSTEYYDETVEHYHQYWNDILTKLASLSLSDIAERFDFVLPKDLSHTRQTYIKLNKVVGDIWNRIDSSIKSQTTIKETLSNISAEYEKVCASLDEAKNKIAITKKITESRLQNAIDNDKRLLRELQTGIAAAKDRMDKVRNEREEIVRAIDSLNYEMERVELIIRSTNENERDAYESLVHSWDKTETLTKLEKDIYSLDAEIKQLPVFSFAKKNELKRQLDNANRNYYILKQGIIAEHVSSLKAARRQEQNRLTEAEEVIGKEIKNINTAQKTIGRLIKEEESLTKMLSFIRAEEYPDSRIIIKDLKDVPDSIKSYDDQFRVYSGAVSTVKTYRERLEQIQNEYDSLCNLNATDSDLETVDAAQSLVNQLRLSEISRNVMIKDMTALYREYGERYRKTNYRHKLYIKLLYCHLYFDSSFPSLFLNIDEAQDISVSEYGLIKSILGKQSVYNLYGDVNQLVYDYKGIDKWEKLSLILTPTVYSLNENYRNTLQITQFCNSEFSAHVFPIGVSGPDVQDLHTRAAIEWIINRKNYDPSSRAAIIYRYGVFDIQSELGDYLINADVSWFNVDDSKVSVISVESAKGLEFDEVVVIVDHMTSNEKYISYTRALNGLVVVRDQFNTSIRVEISEDDPSEQVDILNDDSQIHENTKTTEDSDDTLGTDLRPDTNGLAGIINKDPNDKSEELLLFLETVDEYLVSIFGNEHILNDEQKIVLGQLFEGNNVAFNAPSGYKKTIILYVLAKYMHEHRGLQTIITAEAYLQENELVLAERLGLMAGSITGSIREFETDFKRNKYDVVFIPFDFFAYEDNVNDFVEYFKGKVSCWGVDHPEEEQVLWNTLYRTSQAIGSTSYLMSKTGFDGIDLSGYSNFKVDNKELTSDRKYYELTISSEEEKNNWLANNIEKLWGQGLIYCDNEETCKRVSKILRKKKIKAEAYINVSETSNAERINYLSNAFSKGSLPVLVALHDTGKNLSNPAIRFIVHYDMPDETAVYDLHVTQIGQLATDPVVYDFVSDK